MATLTDEQIEALENTACVSRWYVDNAITTALAELRAYRSGETVPPGKVLVDEAAAHAIAGNVASNVCCADCTNRICGVSELAAKRHDWPTSADCYEAHMRAFGLGEEGGDK